MCSTSGGRGLADFVTFGVTEEEHRAIGDLPQGRGILGLLIEHPEAVRLEHLAEHPDSFGFPPNHPPMDSFLGVPVRIRGTVFGNLYLTEKQGAGSFTEQDETLVQVLAKAAGFVIENARAYAQSERRRAVARGLRADHRGPAAPHRDGRGVSPDHRGRPAGGPGGGRGSVAPA